MQNNFFILGWFICRQDNYSLALKHDRKISESYRLIKSPKKGIFQNPVFGGLIDSDGFINFVLSLFIIL
jgi:hypothetical protein